MSIYKNNFKPPQNFVNIYKSPRGTWPGPPKKEEGGELKYGTLCMCVCVCVLYINSEWEGIIEFDRNTADKGRGESYVGELIKLVQGGMASTPWPLTCK